MSLVGSNQIVVLINPGETHENWSSQIIVSDFTEPHDVDVKDINDDGDLDILAGADILGNTGSNGRFSVWENLMAPGPEACDA